VDVRPGPGAVRLGARPRHRRRRRGDIPANDRFTVADAYLTTVLNWTRFTGVDLKSYPALAAYFQRTLARPSAARAATEKMALFQAA
jgi:glutathione S-transferase